MAQTLVAAYPAQVIVCDPHQDSTTTTCELLDTYGFRAHPAINGAYALELVATVQAHVLICEPFHCNMSAQEIVTSARAINPQIYLIALTAWDLLDEARKPTLALFHKAFLKPIDPVVLLYTLNQAIPPWLSNNAYGDTPANHTAVAGASRRDWVAALFADQ